LGLNQDDVARIVGIKSTKTLRKYYRDDLDFGIAVATQGVAQSLFNMAVSEVHPAATMFWLKCRARWSERPAAEPEEKKKEEASPVSFPIIEGKN
jgi:hypothetical protein